MDALLLFSTVYELINELLRNLTRMLLKTSTTHLHGHGAVAWPHAALSLRCSAACCILLSLPPHLAFLSRLWRSDRHGVLRLLTIAPGRSTNAEHPGEVSTADRVQPIREQNGRQS